MTTKILLTILFSQLLTLGLGLDYSVNPINPANGAQSKLSTRADTPQCINGYGWNGQLCVPCLQVNYGYCTCTVYGGCDTKVCDATQTSCQVLNQGNDYYLVLKATGCSNYGWSSDSSVICTQCTSGYFMVAGICVKPNNCAQMNLVTGTCDSCVDGYYFTQNFQLQTLQSWDYFQNINEVICQSCLNNCKICTSGYTCIQCNDQYYWSPTTQISSLSNTLNDSNAGQCVLCSSKIPNCISCQNSTTCATCRDGYYYTPPSDQQTVGTCTKCIDNCLSCLDGQTCQTCNVANGYLYLQQDNNNNSCVLCSTISGCGTCSTSTGQLTCTNCLSGYVFDSSNVCKICDTNCVSGQCSFTNNSVQCSQCVTGYVVNSNKCQSCGLGCKTCSLNENSISVCSQCLDTYYLNDANNCILCSSSQTLTNCVNCSFNSNATPSLTCTQCAPNTLSNGDNTQCLSAPLGCLSDSYSVSNNVAVCSKCQDTYYLDNNNVCQTCTSSNTSFLRCTFSNNTVTVIQCIDGYFLINNTCVIATTANQQATNLTLQTCQQISTPSNNAYQCSQCLPAALGNNPPQDGVCAYCNCSSTKSNCTSTVTLSISSVTCSPTPTCLPGFYLNVDNNKCLACSTIAGEDLTQPCCGIGLIYSTALGKNNCTSQTATGKARCITSNVSQQCRCDVGYYSTGLLANDYQCNACLSNCDVCTGSGQCDTCSLNYTKVTTSNGVSCVQIKCLKVDSSKGCVSCQYGFYLKQINQIGYCLQCLSPLTNSICRSYSNIAPVVTVTPASLVTAPATPSYLCQNGQYWNGQYCSPCKPVAANGYCLCSTYLDCASIVCNTGYALVQNTCQPIPDGCSTYQISNDGTTLICTACKDSYSLISNVCLRNQNCQQYSTATGNCIQCASGFYLNWQYNTFIAQTNQDTTLYFNNFPSQCTQCDISNCLTCTGPNVCTTCQAGYFWQTSQYLQQQSNGSQGSCLPCMQGCQTCANNQSCQTCFAGYYMVFPYSGINYCQLCTTKVANCLTCDTSQAAPHAQSLIPVCRSCPTGFYLYNGKCVVCTGGCLACDADNSCTQCASFGYAYDQTNKKCVSCSQLSGCTSCTFNGTQLTCTNCADTYYRTTNNNITTCLSCSSANNSYLRCSSSTTPTQCQDSYYLNGQSCYKQLTLNNCLTYDNNQGCTSCISGYIIVGTSCKLCTSTNAQCVKCQVISNVGSSSILQCAACASGYYLTSTFGCTACPNFQGCDSCNSSGCQSCSSGYYPTAVTTDSNNSTGDSTSNNTVTCTTCVTNCQVCQQANSCTKCSDGYFLVTTTSSGTTSVTSSSCFACQPECQTCVAPGTTCTSCIANYVFQNGGCVTLDQANCYSNGTNGCAICKYGYYLNNGVCYQCLNPQSDFLCTNPVDNLLTSATPTTL